VPPLDSPFDRILYGARRVIADADPGASVSEPEARESVGSETWLAPWRGAPHPLSEIEQRLAAILSDDTELAALFCFKSFRHLGGIFFGGLAQFWIGLGERLRGAPAGAGGRGLLLLPALPAWPPIQARRLRAPLRAQSGFFQGGDDGAWSWQFYQHV
jgi:hypothetical protein